jgi:hypothetical protein
MKDLVIAQLTAYGYTVTEADGALIDICIKKVTAYILNEINDTAIPDGLMPAAVDMVCGEFLEVKKTFSPDSLTMIDLSTVVKRIQTGDTTTEFATDSSQTAEGRLDAVIAGLKGAGRTQFNCYRRMRW